MNSSMGSIRRSQHNPSSLVLKPSVKPKFPHNNNNVLTFKVTATSQNSPPNPFLLTLKTAALTTAVILATAGKFNRLSIARAEVPTPISSPLTQFLESNSEAVDSLKSLLQNKLELREDEEALKILENLISAQPEESQWMFLKARVLGELGRSKEARKVFDEILERNPLSFEALFENALLMDQCGESDAVIGRLEEALKLAVEENKAKEARDVRLIMAQIEFLLKNVDGALSRYDELAKEDPTDFRPYFCKGMIFSLLDKNNEAKEEFAKYRELSPKKFEVEGYLRTPLSKMKLFGTDEGN